MVGGGAALAEAQDEHDGARHEIERVKRPDRTDRQREHVERIEHVGALIMTRLDRLYDETSRVRSALRSIGRLLTAKTTVETVPATIGMSMGQR